MSTAIVAQSPTIKWNSRRRALSAAIVRLSLALFLTGVLSAAAPRAASANIINVNTGADGIDFIHCTIRRAIENHNAQGQPNKQCAAGSANDIIFVPQVMDLGDPLPSISGTLEIERNSVVCGEMRQAAYMSVNPGATLILNGVGISVNGSHNISALDNNGGTLIIKAFDKPCRFSNNRTSNLPNTGGVLFNRTNGKVTISGADFIDSHARAKGGAIFIDTGIVQIDDSQPQRTTFKNDSSDQGGAIYVNTGAKLQIASSNFTFTNDEAGSAGGAIFNNGATVTIQRGRGVLSSVSIAHNRSASGGAIFSQNGQLQIDGIEINNNSSSNGGGVTLNGQPATIARTYFHNNSADANGAAVYVSQMSTLNVSASTFSRDRAKAQGGGIYVDARGNLNVVNSTFLGQIDRDGVFVESGSGQIVFSTFVTSTVGTRSSLTLSNSILRDDVCSNVTDAGFNLQFQSTGCPASIPNQNPQLNPSLLANNGGPTPTIALQSGSPAIDAISVGNCVDQQGHHVNTDQRGFIRPAGPACDIGAFEFGAVP